MTTTIEATETPTVNGTESLTLVVTDKKTIAAMIKARAVALFNGAPCPQCGRDLELIKVGATPAKSSNLDAAPVTTVRPVNDGSNVFASNPRTAHFFPGAAGNANTPPLQRAAQPEITFYGHRSGSCAWKATAPVSQRAVFVGAFPWGLEQCRFCGASAMFAVRQMGWRVDYQCRAVRAVNGVLDRCPSPRLSTYPEGQRHGLSGGVKGQKVKPTTLQKVLLALNRAEGDGASISEVAAFTGLRPTQVQGCLRRVSAGDPARALALRSVEQVALVPRGTGYLFKLSDRGRRVLAWYQRIEVKEASPHG